MHLPVIKRKNAYKRSIISFGGINTGGNYSAGEMRDCSGISHHEFPFITQRNKSEHIFSCTSPTAVVPGSMECIAAEDGFYYNRKKECELTSGKKQIAILGKQIMIFPDKLCFDTESKSFKRLDGKVYTSQAKVTFTENSISLPSNYYETLKKEEYTDFPKGTMLASYEKVSTTDGTVTFTGFSLKEVGTLTEGTIYREKCLKNQYRVVVSITYSEEKNAYAVENELVTVNNVGKEIFSHFKEDDTIEIEGCTGNTENNISATVLSVSGEKLTFADGTFTSATETGGITIKRKIPDFTSVCSYENRLWGIEGNTIYASALGDPTAFFSYQGISTDSFTIQSNSAGDFTACIAYGNSCFFFKENTCYKIYGNRPANFQLTECFGNGILKNDARSLVVAGNRIIYKGNGGVYSFYGGAPTRISDVLGPVTMENTTAGSNGKLYYLSADTKNGREEFIWDIEKNLWCKSGVSDVLGYASYGQDVYRLKPDGIEKITQETDEEAFWSITLCPIDEGYYNTKNYSRIRLKVHLFEGAYICTEIKADDGEWKTVDTSYGDKKSYINIPCPIKKCHELQIRLSGKGRSIIETITREFCVN